MDDRMIEKFSDLMKTFYISLKHLSHGIALERFDRFLEKSLSDQTLEIQIRVNVKEASRRSDPWIFIEQFTNLLQEVEKKQKTRKHLQGNGEIYECFLLLRQYVVENFNEIMLESGYCCGYWFEHKKRTIQCSAKKTCVIRKDGTIYYRFKNYSYCETCFSKKPDEFLIEDEELMLKKSSFKEYIWNQTNFEEFVACTICSKRFHQICLCFIDDPDNYICKNCNPNQLPVYLKASQLPRTQCDLYVERFTNKYAKCDPNVFTIRVLSQTNQTLKLPNSILKHRRKGNGDKYSKNSLFVFHDNQGIDVCIFSVIFSLFSEECDSSVKNSVYVNYIDSVKFLPKETRTELYHVILMGLFEYLQSCGYKRLFIWSAPPSDNQDYIFYMKPQSQKTPNQDRLNTWYRHLLKKCEDIGIITSFTTFNEYMNQNSISSITQIPYFDQDLWSSKIIDSIKEADNETKRLKKNYNEIIAKKNKNKKRKLDIDDKIDEAKSALNDHKQNNMRDFIWKEMKNYVEAFGMDYYCAEFERRNDFPNKIFKMDHPAKESIFNSRDDLMDLLWSKNLEFSSIRRVKHSSQVLIKTSLNECNLLSEHQNHDTNAKSQLIREKRLSLEESGYGSPHGLISNADNTESENEVVTIELLDSDNENECDKNESMKYANENTSKMLNNEDFIDLCDSDDEVQFIASSNLEKDKFQKFSDVEVKNFLAYYLLPIRNKIMGLKDIEIEKPERKCPLFGMRDCVHKFKYLKRLEQHLMEFHLRQEYLCKQCSTRFIKVEDRNFHETFCHFKKN